MPFELQPILKGELLTLRPLESIDFDELFGVASDPLIWVQHPDRRRYTEKVFREFFRGAMDSGGAFIVIDNATARAVGSSRYIDYNEANGDVEIGWTFLARSHWGGVYNAEMKKLMMDHAFKFVDKINFVVGVNNLRSQKAVEKIGAVRIGARQSSAGNDSYVYQITRTV